ncbi:MAG: aspartate--tRNA ligase, partial [Deltaproteobacteria bacterium]|nr:aspartate--tRNA ligase [Deltaproteobacteria bacterium]
MKGPSSMVPFDKLRARHGPRSLKRTHTCGDLTAKHAGKKAVLTGWCDVRRDHGGLVFVDLRDRYGKTQVVLDPKKIRQAKDIRPEYVLAVSGAVRKRPKGMENKKMATGAVELAAEECAILNRSPTPPFEISEEKEVGEDLRLQYRFLDLRKPKMQKFLILRHQTAQVVRNYFSQKGFLEIETPMLTRSTPEGARDYLVPSRVQPGKFFALPQSPQLFKQLLMVAGFDKYFQIVKCFRDEDLRADRQPEFTQIDVEAAFVSSGDILDLIEGLMAAVLKEVLNVKIKTPFDRIPYLGAIQEYGSDKPDRRIPWKIVDVSEIFQKSPFKIFSQAVAGGKSVQALKVTGAGDLVRKDFEALEALAVRSGARGLGWAKLTKEG